MKQSEYQFMTIEPASNGLHGVSVKGYKKCRSGVMQGQVLAHFIDSFDSFEEAEEAFPEARRGNKWTVPQPSFDHLPDDGDY